MVQKLHLATCDDDTSCEGTAFLPSAASIMVVWLYRSEMSSSDQLKGTSGSVKKEKRMFYALSFLCGPPVFTGRLTERGFR